MTLTNTWGLTETTGPVTFMFMNNYRLDAGGTEIGGHHLRIDNPDSEGKGEIQIKGRSNMMGYLKNEEATRKAINSEGYFLTGDQGKLVDGKWLVITGRIKELIITSGGENIAPVAVEDMFKLHCAACSNIMLLGEQ